MQTPSLAEELALLVYDSEGKPVLGNPALDYGLAGAILLDLAWHGRVDVTDGRVTVADRAGTGSPLLDDASDQIAAHRRPRPPKDWIGLLGKELHERVLDRLVESGVLRREEGKVLWCSRGPGTPRRTAPSRPWRPRPGNVWRRP